MHGGAVVGCREEKTSSRRMRVKCQRVKRRASERSDVQGCGLSESLKWIPRLGRKARERIRRKVLLLSAGATAWS